MAQEIRGHTAFRKMIGFSTTNCIEEVEIVRTSQERPVRSDGGKAK
jgi:PII-like signaling protein